MAGSAPAEMTGAAPSASAHNASNRSPCSSLSAGERTTELLLDIPRFELGAAVEVHAKARRHVERLEEPHRDDVDDGGGELRHLRGFHRKELRQVEVFPGGREPVHEGDERGRDSELRPVESLRHDEGCAAIAAA